MRKFRKKLTKRGSKRLFKATAMKTHIKNVPRLTRGGQRM